MATQPRRPLLAGNWKMNLNHLEAIALVQKLAFSLEAETFEKNDIAVLPPFTDLRSVQTLVDGDKLAVAYGSQDLSPHDSGAYTGDISGAFLAKLGCTYAVVGHSERRQHHAESDELVNAKVKAALRYELTPILCIGEGLETRQAGEHVSYTLSQLDGGMAGLSKDDAANVVVAYEPVWAIGTGEVATPDDAQEMAAEIRSRVGDSFSADVAGKTRILYGGSVKAANIRPIMDQPDVDGALVGGASLDADEFAAICRFDRG
ncbi:triose-phosphate isomerase [Actinobacteria bacterium YIM 96077]|uniref:Triosephosphate isomerase n=1 Tax=Phytoactinopolyspora halophila TaxID=1981511 RepID=A0A329QMP2_9ACTN|nr:triose-phosphate isomerase [Phytoactinopolyspora halophila]AYY12921.1 triose-phosphate isomerase [Actinobacteria bacterium YIM 96077]RAW13635.1 triose-phosphate isomerase [Phytoactinopolyspora halophila]